MITFLGFLLGLTIGVLVTAAVTAKVVGWMDLIVKEERRLFIKSDREKLES